MRDYLIRRILETVPVLFLASVLVFSIMRLIPGDPAVIVAGESATPEQVERIRSQLGLDGSLPAQYWSWIRGVVTGQFGDSYLTRQPVSRLIGDAATATAELASLAYILALVVGIPLGVLAGVAPRSLWDYALAGFTTAAIGIPNFLLGIILIILFSVHWHVFPAGGRVGFSDNFGDAWLHIILPAIALGVGFGAVLARFVRSSILDTMNEDYIRTARAKGLGDRVIVVRHALRNGLNPVITIAGLQVGRILAGTVVVETVFAWPGVGRLIVSSILGRDYLVVQTLLLLLVLVFVLANLVVDIAYGLVDPRVRVK